MLNINRGSFFLTLWILAFLAGCGGGGSDNNAPTNSSSSVPSGPSFSLSSTALSVEADTSNSAPTISLSVAVLNPPSTTYYYRYNWSGTAIDKATWNWISNTTAQMALTLWPPANAGAGTYSSVLQLQFCLDSACTQPFADSPKNITVTYTVTGDSLPATTFYFDSSSLNVESTVTNAPADVQLPFYIVNRPPYTTYIHIRSAAGGVLSNIDYESDVSPAHLTLSFRDPNSMTAGNHEDTLLMDICFDAACSRKSKDSPKALQLSYSVLAREGKEYSRIEVAGAAQDLVWDPHSERIYAVIKGSSQFTGNLLSKINPTTGLVESTVTLSGMPSSLALSNDGHYAYVIYTVINSFEEAIARIRLDDMVIDTTIHLEMPTNWAYIDDVKVSPSNAEILAVLSRRAGFQGLGIYEQGIKKAEWGEITTPAGSPASFFQSVQWGADLSKLYVYDSGKDNLNVISYLGGGLSLTNAAASFNAGCSDMTPITCRLSSISFGVGAITSGFGAHFNTATEVMAGYYPLGNHILNPALAVDSGNHRTFFYYNDVTSPVVKSFDSDTLKFVVAARIAGLDLGGNIGDHVSHIIKWGQNGLAMNTPWSIVIITGSFVTQ